MFRGTLLFTLASLLIGADCGWSEEFAWRLQAGDRFRLTCTQSISQRTEVLLKPLEVTSRMELELDWQVQQVDATGQAVIQQTLQRVALEMSQAPDSQVTYDSQIAEGRNAWAKDLHAALEPLFATNMSVTLSPRGEITDVTIPPEALESFQAVSSSQRLSNLLTPQAVKEMLSPLTLPLPEGDTEIGTVWEASRRATTPGLDVAVTHQLEFTGLESRSDQSTARIDFTTQLTALPKGDASPKTPKIKSHASQGSLWFDVEDGYPLESRQTQTLVTTSQLREMVLTSTATSESVCTLRRLDSSPDAANPPQP